MKNGKPATQGICPTRGTPTCGLYKIHVKIFDVTLTEENPALGQFSYHVDPPSSPYVDQFSFDITLPDGFTMPIYIALHVDVVCGSSTEQIAWACDSDTRGVLYIPGPQWSSCFKYKF